MANEGLFNEEIIEKFNKIGCELYNLKYSFQLFIDCLENTDNVSIDIICFGIIMKEYFEKVKDEYNQLEETLNIFRWW